MAIKLITVKAQELKRGDSLYNTASYFSVEGVSWQEGRFMVHLRSTNGTGHTSEYHHHEPVKVWREEPFTDEEIADLFYE